MGITVIILSLTLAVIVGYAARQRQDLLETTDRVGELTRENERLLRDKRDHERTLDMLLVEIDRIA